MRSENVWRFNILGVVFGLMGGIIFLQTIRLQIIPEGQEISQEGEDFFRGVMLEMDTPRGQIFDREGHLLAGNHFVYEIGVALKYVKDSEDIVRFLNDALDFEALNLDYVEILEGVSIPYHEHDPSISDDPPSAIYKQLVRGVSLERGEFIDAHIEKWKQDVENGVTPEYNLSGLVTFKYLHRYYPEGSLAAGIIGFVALDGKGYFGIEEKYNDQVSGDSQKVWIPFNPNYVTETPREPSADNLVLTIDRDIQAMIEDVMDYAIDEYYATSATIVIMNPETGEIYAMASTPSVDLNEYWTLGEVFPKGVPFNRAVSQAYEPGSVFKIFTMAAALESETVTPETKYTDEGSIVVGDETIKNWDEQPYGELDMIGCLALSSNVCLAWVGTEIGADTFFQYMDDFGFGHTTGIDLAGETPGLLRYPGGPGWTQSDLGTNSFGQGVSTTVIQLLMAASAIANDGEMMLPYVVRSFEDNKSQYNVHSQVTGRPISVKTARLLTEMLAISLEQETLLALVPGYRVAGKTGTAQIPDEVKGGYKGETNASFIGWGPVDDPKFLVYVWLEAPDPEWGSLTAAPVFSLVVEQLVVLLDIPPDHVREELSGN